MANLRLLIEVLTKNTGDLRKLNSDMKRTGEEAEKTGSKISGMGKALGAFATGFVAFKALDFLSDATNAAAEFNDTVSASGVILGEEALPELEAWADGAARAFGASKQQALDAANTFAVFGKSAGLAGEDLTTFSTDLTELAGDLASFRGGTTEEAITAIGAALRGESEPIRRYGVLLDDATLRQRALRLGIIETTKQALTPQQKVLAAQAEIFEQTADAQGDFARTGDDMANVQRTLAAEFDNVTIEIGQKLLPVLLEFATWIRDDGIPLINTLVEYLDEAGEAVDAVAHHFDFSGSLFGNFSDDATRVAELVEEMGVGAGEAAPLLEHFSGNIGLVRQEMERWAEEGITFDEGMRELTDGITMLPQNIKAATSQIEPAITGSTGGVADALAGPLEQGAGDGVDAVENMYTEIARTIRDKEEALRQAGGDAVEAWLDPQITTYDIARAEAELASEDLRKELASKDPEIKADAEKRRLELVAELISLKNEQATQGEATAQIAHTKALLTSDFMLSGLESKDPEIRATFEAWKVEAELHLGTLVNEARGYGLNTATEYSLGLDAGYGVVVDAAGNLARAVRNQIGINSEPKDPSSPLHGITKWGGNIAQTLAEGMSGAVGLVSSASRTLGGAISEGTLQGFSVAPGAIPDGGTGTVGAGGIHIHLYNMGDPIEEDDDVLESLRLLVPHIRDAVFSNG